MRLTITVLLLAIPAAVAAEAPKVAHFFPAGARRGTAVEATAGGTFKPWPVEVHIDRSGLEFVAGEEEGHFTATVAADAPAGVYWIRLYNDEGSASLRPFIVGTLPEVVEAEPNDALNEAQEVESTGVVVNGRLEKSGDVDSFAVAMEAGQTLVAALEANRRIGSPMDGVLQVVSPEGFVVDQNDDAPLLDPMLSFTAPNAGTYVVRTFAFPATPDSSIRFAGSADYVYRLTLTSGGYADHAHPSAAAPESPPVGLLGPGIPDHVEARTEVVDSTEPATAVAWHPEVAGITEVRLVDHPVVVESGEGSTALPLPASACGHIERPDEADRYEFRASKGAAIAFRVEARALGSPLDPTIRVLDADGATLAEADDTGKAADPVLRFEPPADGSYRLELRDLHGRGGPRYFYRVEAVPVVADYALTVDTDHFDLAAGKPLELAVAVDRRDGFDLPVVVVAEGLPAGVSAEPVTSTPKGDSAKRVTLRVITEASPGWSGSIRIIGRSANDGPSRAATAGLIGGLSTDAIWLTVPRTASPPADDDRDTDPDGTGVRP